MPAAQVDPLELLNTQQAADRTGLSKETLIKWRKQRRGIPFCRMGRTVRYRTVDVESWLIANTVNPADKATTSRPAPAVVQTATDSRWNSPHLRGGRPRLG